MTPASRAQEHDKIEQEINDSRPAWADDPDAAYIDRIALMVFRPFCHFMVDVKHDAMGGQGNFKPDNVRLQVSALLGDMAMEFIRHLVSVDDLDGQVMLAQKMINEISAGLSASINDQAEMAQRIRSIMRAN